MTRLVVPATIKATFEYLLHVPVMVLSQLNWTGVQSRNVSIRTEKKYSVETNIVP
jgi:hypothetical protein